MKTKKWYKCERLGIKVCNTEQNMTYSDAVKSLKKGERLLEDWETCLVFRTMYKELNIVRWKDYWNKEINGVGRLSYLDNFFSISFFVADIRDLVISNGVRGVIICKDVKKK